MGEYYIQTPMWHMYPLYISLNNIVLKSIHMASTLYEILQTNTDTI